MGDIRIIQTVNMDGAFYRLMGPFLANREVAKELGCPVWDDDDRMWFLAMLDIRLVGFVAIASRRTHDRICSAYVVPDMRRRGVFAALLDNCLAVCDGEVRTMATDMSMPAFLARGFSEVRRRGRFYDLRRTRGSGDGV